MPSDSDTSDLGEVSEEEELHHTDALPLEIKNVSDDGEEEVDESGNDTALKNKQMAPYIIYRREHIDGEKNIPQLVPLKLMRIHSAQFLMMLPNGLH